MGKYKPIAVPHGFITRLAEEAGTSRTTASRAVLGLFAPYGTYTDNFLSIRAKACEMLGIENTDTKE